LAARTGLCEPVPTLTRPSPEVAPSIAPLSGGDYLVAWQMGETRMGVSFATSPAAALAPEALGLSADLVEGQQGDVSLLRTARGLWFAWSDAGRFGEPTARRSFLAFLLPVDGGS